MKVYNNIINKHNANQNGKIQIKKMHNPLLTQTNYDTVSFKGMGLNNFISLKSNDVDGFIKHTIFESPSILDVSRHDVNQNLKSATPIQKELFANMVHKYNSNNFYVDKAERENPQIVFDLLKNIKKPTALHLSFINKTNFSLTEIMKIMENLDYKSKLLESFIAIEQELSDARPETQKLVFSITNSKNKEEIISNYPKYRAFFKRHFNEENIIQNLDNQIANGTFNPILEKQKYSLERRANLAGFKNVIDVEKLAPFASKESNSIIDVMHDRFNPSQLKDKSDYKKNLEEIYKTTNKQNFVARFNYIRSYHYSSGIHEYKASEMSDINALFKRMDENPQVMKFIKYISVKRTNEIGAGELLKIIDSVDIKKLDLYKQQIRRIIPSKDKNPAEKIIRYCRLQPDTQFGKIKKGIQFHLAGLSHRLIKKLPK